MQAANIWGQSFNIVSQGFQMPAMAVDSIDRCNTLGKLLSWGLILQGPAWSFVQLPRNGTQLGLRMNGQVSSSGQILP